MRGLVLLVTLMLGTPTTQGAPEGGLVLAEAFQREVDRRLEIPVQEQLRYAQLLEAALAREEIRFTGSQYLLLLDRNANVQALLLYWLDSQADIRFHFIGASPASTGLPGRRGHFITPTGVFAHTLKNKDFRAEGTFNKLGIRGYGRKGMRIFDFGWVQAERGWGSGGIGQMRLLLHATDPDRLEPSLGIQKSKGCIRIPATLNDFIDRYGILDADYEQALADGKKLWAIRSKRTPTAWSGRYLVIVDSGSAERPEWSPDPMAEVRQQEAEGKTDKVR